MPITFSRQPVSLGVYDRFISVFLRIMAMFLLLFALKYWAMIIGYPPGSATRFDQMNEPWRTAGATLSVLFPIAALGLWGQFAWGGFIWFLAIAIEAVIYGWYNEIFGSNRELLLFHLISFSGFLTLLAGRFFSQRR